MVRRTEAWCATYFHAGRTVRGIPIRLKPRDRIALSLGTPRRQIEVDGTVWHILSAEEDAQRSRRGSRSAARHRGDSESDRLPQQDRYVHLACAGAVLDAFDQQSPEIHAWRDGRNPRIVLIAAPQFEFVVVMVDARNELLLTTCYPLRRRQQEKMRKSRDRGNPYP